MERPRPWTTSVTAATLAASVGVVLAFLALLAPLTPRVAFNDGLGYYDGQVYAALVVMLRGALETEVGTPYVFRIAPIALVAWSGMPPISGLLFFNVVATIACAPLVVLLLRRYGVSPWLALVGVAWLCALPPGLRFTLAYPTLIDGMGELALLALLTSAAYGRFALFAALLPIALLTRENLVVAIPFLWLANLRGGPLRSGVASLLASLPGLAALALVRLAPPIEPTNGTTALFDMRQNLDWFLANADGRAWRYLAAPPLALGLLAAIPFARWRASVAWLGRSPEWIWWIAVTMLLALVGGGDYDRFAYWLAPALLVTAFVALGAGRVGGLAALGLTALQLVAIRFGDRLGSDEESYRAWVVALMDQSRMVELLVRTAAVCLAGMILAAVAADRVTPRRPPVPAEPDRSSRSRIHAGRGTRGSASSGRLHRA